MQEATDRMSEVQAETRMSRACQKKMANAQFLKLENFYSFLKGVTFPGFQNRKFPRFRKPIFPYPTDNYQYNIPQITDNYPLYR